MKASELLSNAQKDVLDCHKLANGEYETELPRNCQMINAPAVKDERGQLCYMESGSHIPFPIARVFYIYNVQEGATRGDHSHNTCAEVVFAVSGAFTMTVDDGNRRVAIRMNRPDIGILIPPGVWCKLSDFEEGTVCSVLASERYDASGYTLSYEEYINNQNNRGKR